MRNDIRSLIDIRTFHNKIYKQNNDNNDSIDNYYFYIILINSMKKEARRCVEIIAQYAI